MELKCPEVFELLKVIRVPCVPESPRVRAVVPTPHGKVSACSGSLITTRKGR